MRPLKPSLGYRADPAPSRWSYRFMRLMLSPVLRRVVYYGIPAAALCMGGAIYFADVDRRDAVMVAYNDAYRAVIERPEFMVNVVAIHGASPALDMDIRDILPVDFPVSQFDLDVQDIHAMLTDLDPVADVRIQIAHGGTLQIDVVERTPAFLWRDRDTLEVLDATGAYVRSAISRVDYPSLPLIAGTGADKNIAEAKAILAAARPIADRIRGLVYVGERRWDIELTGNQVVMLPEDNPVQAVERVLVMDKTQDVFARAIAVVDMRLPQRPTLRVAPPQTDMIVETLFDPSEASQE